MPLDIARYLVSTLRGDPQLRTLMGVTPNDPRVYPYYHASATIEPVAGKKGYITYANTSNNERLSAVGGSVWSLAVWADTDVTGVAMRDRILALLDCAGDRERTVAVNGDRYQPVKISEHWSTQENTKFFGIQLSLRFGYSFVDNPTPLVGPSTGVSGSDAVAVSEQAVLNLLTPYQARILADGPLAYWPLDDAVGSTTARDLVGARLGTLQGSVTCGVPGVGGGTAMRFTGGGVEIPPLPTLLPGFSYEAWVQVDTLAAGLSHTVISRLGACRMMVLFTNGRLTFQVFKETSYTVTTTLGTVVGVWNHVVLTHDGTTATVHLNDIVGISLAYPLPLSDTATLASGLAYDVNSGNNLRGSLQDVAVYGRALSVAEILAHNQLHTL